jgi:Zn-dependent peptidase ImmA (M78 family)
MVFELDPIEAEAERARLRAGIRPEAIAPDVEASLRALGLLVASRPLGRGRPEAIYTGQGLAVVNSTGLPAHTRFVAAHLLAHHLYHDRPHVERKVERPRHDASQRRASAFAACFLVGRQALLARAPGRITTEIVLRLAREFQVSYEVMGWRLCEVGLIQAGEHHDLVPWRPAPNGHPRNGVSHSLRRER